MIDPKIFAELQNRGIITVVGLEPTQFENLEALKNLGLATSIATEAEYKAAVEKLIDMNALLEKFLADNPDFPPLLKSKVFQASWSLQRRNKAN